MNCIDKDSTHTTQHEALNPQPSTLKLNTEHYTFNFQKLIMHTLKCWQFVDVELFYTEFVVANFSRELDLFKVCAHTFGRRCRCPYIRPYHSEGYRDLELDLFLHFVPERLLLATSTFSRHPYPSNLLPFLIEEATPSKGPRFLTCISMPDHGRDCLIGATSLNIAVAIFPAKTEICKARSTRQRASEIR